MSNMLPEDLIRLNNTKPLKQGKIIAPISQVFKDLYKERRNKRLQHGKK